MDGFLALYVFILAAFTGYEIIGRVPVILHTPLMSGSNFVHGIVLVGAMVVLGHADTTFEKVVGFIAVLMGAGNAAGGYVVTERMLEMFKKTYKNPNSEATGLRNLLLDPTIAQLLQQKESSIQKVISKAVLV